MKKITLLTALAALILFSCANPTKNNANSELAAVEIGSASMDGMDSMAPLVVGEISNQQIWLDYIQAHNDKNLEKIADINAEDWVGYTADGSVVKGNKAHIEVLEAWFQSANPKWKVKWMIANAVTNKEGVVQQWLTTGNDYTDVDENGNEIMEHNVHDIQFVDGKIKQINVYKRAKAQEDMGFSY